LLHSKEWQSQTEKALSEMKVGALLLKSSSDATDVPLEARTLHMNLLRLADDMLYIVEEYRSGISTLSSVRLNNAKNRAVKLAPRLGGDDPAA
jgi:hypothetical protein